MHLKVPIELDMMEAKHDNGEENSLIKTNDPQETRNALNNEHGSVPLHLKVLIELDAQKEPAELTYDIKENPQNKNIAELGKSHLQGPNETKEENYIDSGSTFVPSNLPTKNDNIYSKHASVAAQAVSFDKGEGNCLDRRDTEYGISPIDDNEETGEVDFDIKSLQYLVPIKPGSNYNLDETELNKKN